MKHQINKGMLKSEVADLAGVPLYTLRRWLQDSEQELLQFGYQRRNKYLCPRVIKYLNDKYVIL